LLGLFEDGYDVYEEIRNVMQRFDERKRFERELGGLNKI
jgi:hypothetical protein